MRILCSMPGRHGDILWSLVVVRAISETYGERVDLLVSEKYGSLTGLIERQDYIGRCVADTEWTVTETAPMTPRTPPVDVRDLLHVAYDRVFHLGYEGWPQGSLPEDIYRRANAQFEAGGMLRGLDLTRPWITAPYPVHPTDLCVGFTDEHFELKYGITQLLIDRYFHDPGTRKALVTLSNSPRWNTEGARHVTEPIWEVSAGWLSQTKVFVGCCSALHVLAVAMGVPAVIVEPAAARLQEVFWPLGFDGEKVQVVRGGDGLPTVDARHTAEAIETVWKRQGETSAVGDAGVGEVAHG